MTAAVWKKVPQWIENPAMVYRDPRNSGRIVVIPPESVAGYHVMLVVEPNPTPAMRGDAQQFQLLVTAYAKTSGQLPAPEFLAARGNLLFLDTKNAPEVLRRAGVQFPGQADLQRGRTKIPAEKHLAGRCRANPASQADAPSAPAQSIPRSEAEAIIGDFQAAGLQRITLAERAEDLPQDGKKRIESEGLASTRGMYAPAARHGQGCAGVRAIGQARGGGRGSGEIFRQGRPRHCTPG